MMLLFDQQLKLYLPCAHRYTRGDFEKWRLVVLRVIEMFPWPTAYVQGQLVYIRLCALPSQVWLVGPPGPLVREEMGHSNELE
jgi:hypothetical protein